jgi:uncharacterized GH25 family protein
MKRSIRILLILAALAFAAGAQARVATGTLVGTVLDSHGKPVAHATVTLQTSYGDHPNATHTDANGHFAFARYRTGQYDVRAYANGVFSAWKQRVVIRRNRTTEITLRLPPAK